MKQKSIILLTVFMAICHIAFGQEERIKFDITNQQVIRETVSAEELQAERFMLEIQNACDSLGFNYQVKALICAFAKIRTKNFTDPCCKYNNIFKTEQAIWSEVAELELPLEAIKLLKPSALKEGGFAFPSVQAAILNLQLLTIKRILDKNQKRNPEVTDFAETLLFMAGNDISSQDIEEIKETYQFYLQVYNPETLKDILKQLQQQSQH